jgi:hypothetical protein
MEACLVSGSGKGSDENAVCQIDCCLEISDADFERLDEWFVMEFLVTELERNGREL